MRKRKVNPASTNNLPDHTAKVAEAIKAAIASTSAIAECASTFDSITAKWAFVDGRSCRTPEAIAKHASNLSISAAQVREVLKWTAELIAGYVEMHKAAKGEDKAKADAYAFVLSIKRHSAAFIAAGGGTRDSNAKGKGKAGRAKPKAKAKAKAKPVSVSEAAGRSPKALHAYLTAIMPAFDLLIDARGKAGLSVESLKAAKATQGKVCEAIGKLK